MLKPLYTCVLICFILLSTKGFTQNDSLFISQIKGFNIQVYAQFQVWSTYTMGHEVYEDSTQRYRRVSNRFNTQVRRGRFGFKGQPYPGLSFNITGALDFVGRDVYSGTVGGTNSAPFPNLALWQAYLTWKISRKNEGLNLTLGYLPPMFSRATIVSAFSSTSFEKSFSQNYIRRHLVGTGPGRTVGLDLGGLLQGDSPIGILYHAGIYSPLHSSDNSSLANISAGTKAPPLFTGKAALQIGQPEIVAYKLFLDVNQYSKRRGLSLSLNGSYQGQTDLFTESTGWGTDFLFNWDEVNIDGEWIWMNRSGRREINGNIRNFSYGSQTGYLRASYNLIADGKYFLEPMFMWQGFRGSKEALEQNDARAIKADSGTEDHYEIGLNWYLNKRNLKFSLHYIWRDGDAGELGDGAAINLFFNQAPVGAIRSYVGLGMQVLVRRGDYVGLGMQVLVN